MFAVYEVAHPNLFILSINVMGVHIWNGLIPKQGGWCTDDVSLSLITDAALMVWLTSETYLHT